MRHEIIFEFIKEGNFSKENIDKLKKRLLINDRQLLRLVFKDLNFLLGKIINKSYYINLIKNCVNLIYILCTEYELSEEDVEVNKIRINMNLTD